MALIDQAETVSRRVDKFAELMRSVWLSKNDYERRVREVSYHYSVCDRMSSVYYVAPFGCAGDSSTLGRHQVCRDICRCEGARK